jgi:hypothetical protein
LNLVWEGTLLPDFKVGLIFTNMGHVFTVLCVKVISSGGYI